MNQFTAQSHFMDGDTRGSEELVLTAQDESHAHAYLRGRFDAMDEVYGPSRLIELTDNGPCTVEQASPP